MRSAPRRVPTVPSPKPPGDPGAWYAPDVRSETEVYPGVVVTVRETEHEFAYDVREPTLTATEREALESVETYFEGAHIDRPRTREGAVERMADGFSPKHERVLDRLLDVSHMARRRIEYRALCSLTCLGELTPYALDDRIDVADVASDAVVVHTENFAPARTTLDPDTPFLERFASERIGRHTVSFHEFEIPVILYRENVLGEDPFTTKYAVGVILVLSVLAMLALGVPAPDTRGPQLDTYADDAVTILANEAPEHADATRLSEIVASPTSFARERATLDRRIDRILPDNLMYRLETPHGSIGYPMPADVLEGRATATTASGTITLRVWYV